MARRIVSCRRCPRLVEYRERIARTKRRAFMDQEYWGKPVPGFGDPGARLVIVGLAPAAHGANRTGRMFTGDGPHGAGDTLMRALSGTGLASLPYARSRDDGLSLRGVYLTAALRCVPPKNRPLADELRMCLPFLVQELELLGETKVLLALGKIAFDACLRALELMGYLVPRPRPPFGHGRSYRIGPYWLVSSYHPSRQNTQTGRLPEGEFREVIARAARLAGLPGG